ncbi:hypothetical protein [Schlesneria paludicola]|uniref:hypothetical protein n=1 Tax=Schlesneria paludicola TaxID=360056 RepID=UPI00029B01A0|nr:hypothetical protein [Schlesneria paludicola]
MISFLFLDNIGGGRGPMSAISGALIIGSLCAAGLTIVGYPRGQTLEYGVGGFVVGAIAGFIGFSRLGDNKPLVQTVYGNYSQKDLLQLGRQRSKLNQFMGAVQRKVLAPVGQFGNVDEPSMLMHQMLLSDARKMGIRISDSAVQDYLKQVLQGRLSRADFNACLKDAQVGEGELYELLKAELAANLVVELTQPPAHAPQIPQGFERFINPQESLRYIVETPFQLWDIYQKLTLKESLQAVPLPVKDFVGKVAEPTETELLAFFEKFSKQRWVSEAQPGFVQMPRVQLAYLTGDFEKFEKGADPTDEDVLEYYQKFKDRYRIAPDKAKSQSELPGTDVEASKSDADVKPEADKAPDPATTSEAAPKSEVAPPADEKKSEEKKSAEGGDAKPEVKESSEQPKVDPPKEQPKPEADPKSSCGEEPAKPEATATEEKPAADAKPADPKPETPEVKAEPAAESKPEASAAEPANSTSDDQPKSDESLVPPSPDATTASAPPKYRELDDELKLEIREAILRDRAFAKMSQELDKALDFMVRLGLDYDATVDATQKAEKLKQISEKMTAYAQEHKLEYKTTGELTYEELVAEPIGSSFEGNKQNNVANDVFIVGPNNEPLMPLYSPRRADQRFDNQAFAYWKVAEFPARLSDFKDDAVRARVLSAWKFEQARGLAEKRAEELVAKIKAQGNDVPAAIAGTSVTGEPSDPALTMIATEEFTWLTSNQKVPSASQRGPTISSIPLVEGAGNGFMKVVFDDLADGDVGSSFDDTRSTLYIVKVLNRDGGKNDEGGVAKQERQLRFMGEEFDSKLFPIIKSPYQTFSQAFQSQIDQSWRRNFEQQHNVVWDEDAIAARSRRSRRGQQEE